MRSLSLLKLLLCAPLPPFPMYKSVFSFLFGLLSLASVAVAQDNSAEIERINADRETTDKSFAEWQTYQFESSSLQDGNLLRYHMARSDEEPALMCLRVENNDDHGRLLATHYFKGDDMEMLIIHTESIANMENAPRVVTETRYYFTQGQLIQAWKKKASFPTDEDPNLDAVEDKQLALDEVPDAGSLYQETVDRAKQVGLKMLKIISDEKGDDAAPAVAAGAGDHRTGDGWRLIQGTESPMYQELGIGWHVKGDPELQKDDDGALYYGPEADDKVENVVVNLKTGEIIGRTHGTHGSDKAHFSQAEMTNETVWSGSREFMVQMAQAKHFDTLFAELYHLPEMQSVSEGTDLVAAVKSALVSTLTGKMLSNVKSDSYALGLHDVLIARRNTATVLSVGTDVMIPNEDGPDFTITFKVTLTKAGTPKLTLLDVVNNK